MMTRLEVLRVLSTAFPEVPVVSTCGVTCRELSSLGVQPNQLYMVNSMGLAGPIGMGIALGTGRKTLVIEGDGGLLMGLNFVATLGSVRPPGLVLAVLDNGAHCSTGGQPTAARTVNLGAIASGAGLGVWTAATPDELSAAVRGAREASEPVFLHIRISTAGAPNLPYFQPDPPAVAARFQEWLRREQGE